ncbi:MAG: homoserine kinase [Acutalibacteraceae bacterium]|nr:homoserine kinase [Acutalibacteraceae bacterium]
MVKCTVRVPATTANLGPGFDSVGCAFSLYNTISFEIRESGISFTGCEDKYANEENLAYVGFKAVYTYLGKTPSGCHITFNSIDVPVSRGLGSSAALIVAGATAANRFLENALTKEEILTVCNSIEGHPDNLSPAIYGGLTASFVKDDIPYSVSYNIHPSLKFVALVPDFHLLTKTARSVLPTEIPFGDAVFNSSRLAVLLKALEKGDKKLINLSLDDRLHQPYRRGLIKGYDEAEKIAFKLGCIAFCLSGAGPTCLCLTDSDSFADDIKTELSKSGYNWEVLNLPVDNDGAKLI